MIFANRYYLRKLNLDGSNYTLIKQVRAAPAGASHTHTHTLISPLPPFQGLNNAVALDFHYAEEMIYWTDVTTQGSMIRRMRMNGSNMEVSPQLLLGV